MKNFTFLILVIFIINLKSAYAQFGNNHIISSNEKGLVSVLYCDVDNDGYNDLITASSTIDKISWYHNLSGQGFSEQIIISTDVDSVSCIHIGDIDNDGDIDIVSSSVKDGKIALYKNENGQFAEQQIIMFLDSAMSVHLLDIDNDGDLDLLSSSYANITIGCQINDGTGNFGNRIQSQMVYAYTQQIESIDINNDGFVDIATYNNRQGGFYYYLNDGGVGTFTAKGGVQTSNIGCISTGDINGDNKTDIIVTDYAAKIYYNDSDSININENTEVSVNNGIVYTVLYDFDGDNDLDIVGRNTPTGEEVFWMENTDGLGTFGPEQTIIDSVYETKFIIADFNNDSIFDILVFAKKDENTNHSIYIYTNNGLNEFDTIQAVNASELSNSVASKVADIDNDGDMDIIASQFNINRLVLYKNDGLGNFGDLEYITNVSNAEYFSSISAGDVDGDNIVDIVASKFGYYNLVLFKGIDGQGEFSNEVTLIPAGGLSFNGYTELTDIDGDNDLDIVCSRDILDASYQTVIDIVWLENTDGQATFSQPNVISTDSLTLFKVVDIDNDGDKDIVSVSQKNGKVVWIKNTNGLGDFSVQNLIHTINVTGMYDNISATFSDVDNDNDIDIIISNKTTSEFYWIENINTFSSTAIHNISTPSNVGFVANACKDIDGDGDNDIVTTFNDKIAYFENDGTGNFINIWTIKNSNNLGTYNIGNFDNDNDLDVLSLGFDDVEWVENFSGDNVNTIKGNIFYDYNSNGIKDGNDYGLTFINTQLSPNSLGSFTNTTGDFGFAVDLGNYILSYQPLQDWDLTSDSSQYHIELNSQNQTIEDLDFGFYPNNFNTNIIPNMVSSSQRCDDENILYLSYLNNGTTTPDGVIELILDDSITFVSSQYAPDSVVYQTLYWHFDSLNYFELRNQRITVLMPDFNSMGNIITNILNIYTTDITGQNTFSDTLYNMVICSYDPNDKIVTPKGEGVNGVVSNTETLEYTVRFQNTGNAEAINIKIRDQIDEDLEIQSMQILASSHNVDAFIQLDNWLVFQFDSIMLPDSSTSFLESQGFVKYSIRVSNTALPNAPIYNTANIYFDNNPAVITNTTLNTVECYIEPTPLNIIMDDTLLIVSTSNNVQWYYNDYPILGATDTSFYPTLAGNFTVEVFDENGCSSISDAYVVTKINKQENIIGVSIYPNPTTGLITVKAENIKHISVLNINGKQLFTTTERTFNLSAYPKGLYFVKVTTQNGVTVKKVILE